MGWKERHGWRSFSHFRDISILWAFSSRCLSIFLAGTTVQGFSGCDKASSSMYLGEASSGELSYLVEGEANRTGDDSACFRTSLLQQQRWRQCRCGDGAAERMVGGKGRRAWCNGASATSLLL